MDGSRFDRIAREAGRERSRRGVLKLLFSAAVGGGFSAASLERASAVACRSARSLCNRDSQCCSGTCLPRDRSGRRYCACTVAADCPHPEPGDQCRVTTCDDGICSLPVLVGADCDDGNPCTTGDACDDRGRCVGTPIVCSAPDDCFTAGGCDPTSGLCPDPIYKGDGTACGAGAAGRCWRQACCTPGTRASICVNDVCGPQPDGCGNTIDCGTCCLAATASCTADRECCSGSCLAGVCQTGKAVAGVQCDSAGDCQSGFCADGVCCDSACTGQCEACDRSGLAGTCSPVTGVPVGGRPACAGSVPCAGTCDGTVRDTCTYPDTDVVCQNAYCSPSGQVVKASACDGEGGCTAPAPVAPADLCYALTCRDDVIERNYLGPLAACGAGGAGHCLGDVCCMDTFYSDGSFGQVMCCTGIDNACPSGAAPGEVKQCCYDADVCIEMPSGASACVDPGMVCGGAFCNGECCGSECCQPGTGCSNGSCVATPTAACIQDSDCGAGFSCTGNTTTTDYTTNPSTDTVEPGTCCPAWSVCGAPQGHPIDGGRRFVQPGKTCCGQKCCNDTFGSKCCDYGTWLECKGVPLSQCSPRGGRLRV